MKPTFLPFLLLPLLLSACGDKSAEVPKPAPVAPAISAVSYESLRSYPQREAPASVLGKNETRLAAEVSARILTLPVDAGDRVRKGQIVARLDARDAELALARADAALAQAHARAAQVLAQTQRARSLREKNFLSAEALTLRETELVLAEADTRAAQAARATAARGVEKSTLRAPFDAIVRARSGQVGEITAPGAPLLTLADTSDLQLVAQVQARDAESLAQAAAPEFVAGGIRHALKPLQISGAISREARTIEARFSFASAPLPPGSEGRLVWRDAQAHILPDMMVRRSGRYGVFVVEADKVRFVAIDGAQEGRPAALDLPPDTRVAQQGRQALQDGMSVVVQSR
ncbi:MAG: efflux RND transporter periplasmic adaptor subunit [Burkholderiaceae bacterium]|nr:efflux RND transporter periplasmic adaptor subunit [Burkholderiaceae bacterium]